KGYTDIRLHDDEALKAAVATVGPISIGVHSGNKHVQLYDGGIFTGDPCPRDEVDHGILLIGYGTDEDVEDYWLS
nr:hypothetical protein [Shewanella shenzhenensis]